VYTYRRQCCPRRHPAPPVMQLTTMTPIKLRAGRHSVCEPMMARRSATTNRATCLPVFGGSFRTNRKGLYPRRIDRSGPHRQSVSPQAEITQVYRNFHALGNRGGNLAHPGSLLQVTKDAGSVRPICVSLPWKMPPADRGWRQFRWPSALCVRKSPFARRLCVPGGRGPGPASERQKKIPRIPPPFPATPR